jgi:hypothetical protein
MKICQRMSGRLPERAEPAAAGRVRDLYHCENEGWIDVTQYHARIGAPIDGTGVGGSGDPAIRGAGL